MLPAFPRNLLRKKFRRRSERKRPVVRQPNGRKQMRQERASGKRKIFRKRNHSPEDQRKAFSSQEGKCIDSEKKKRNQVEKSSEFSPGCLISSRVNGCESGKWYAGKRRRGNAGHDRLSAHFPSATFRQMACRRSDFISSGQWMPRRPSVHWEGRIRSGQGVSLSVLRSGNHNQSGK